MAYNPEVINTLIKKRRSIFPKTYVDRPIPKELIEQVLENANWAPTHKFTEPWRFKVFTGEALSKLGTSMAATYKKHMPAEKFSETKFEKMKKKPTLCGCIIAICMQRDPEERVPEWEEIASVACAVQNMWLTCTAYNIGCYWSSPGIVIKHAANFLNMREGEQCLGFFYMGQHQMPELPGKRSPITNKTEWISS